MAKAEGKAVVSFPEQMVTKVKLDITMFGVIPDTEPNTGQMSALFADEIIVE